MGSVKAVLFRGKVLKDGTSPIVIQVIQNDSIKRKTVFNLHPQYWNSRTNTVKDNHPHADQLNTILQSMLNDVTARYLALKQKKAHFEASDAFEFKESITLQDAIDKYLTKPDTSFAAEEKYINLKNKVNEFSNSKPVTFDSINVKWMTKYRSYLENKNLAQGTISRYLSNIKTVLRYSEFNVTSVLNFKTPKGEGESEPLSFENFEKIQAAVVPDGWVSLAKDVFLFQTYIRGTRVGETLMITSKMIKENNLTGTKSNKTGKVRTIELIPKAMEIIEKYKGQSEWYIFPILQMKPSDPKKDRKYYKHISSKVATLNENLKRVAKHAGVDERLTTHMSRHTFALMCVNAGLDLKTIQNLFDHSNIATTAKYLRGVVKDSELNSATKKAFGI